VTSPTWATAKRSTIYLKDATAEQSLFNAHLAHEAADDGVDNPREPTPEYDIRLAPERRILVLCVPVTGTLARALKPVQAA